MKKAAGLQSVDRVDAVAELSMPPLMGGDPGFEVLGFGILVCGPSRCRGRAVHTAARGQGSRI